MLSTVAEAVLRRRHGPVRVQHELAVAVEIPVLAFDAVHAAQHVAPIGGEVADEGEQRQAFRGVHEPFRQDGAEREREAGRTDLTGNLAKYLALVSHRTPGAAQMFLAMIPILVVYPYLQKYFTTGLMMGSVKG